MGKKRHRKAGAVVVGGEQRQQQQQQQQQEQQRQPTQPQQQQQQKQQNHEQQQQKQKRKEDKKKAKEIKRAVAEGTRNEIAAILEGFLQSNEQVYKFDASLSNNQRAVVHELSGKMGMKSKSSGGGSKRQVSVFKSEKEDDKNEKNNLPFFALSSDSKEVLHEVFARYPPGDELTSEEIFLNRKEKKGQKKKIRDDMFVKPSMNKAEIARRVDIISHSMQEDADLRKITEERGKLPIASFRDAILSTVNSNQVVLISGETGCGKTTQVPQFILDSMWAKGETCKIVCTQPRRISAVSVSERVSFERGEKPGEDIGYKIRLESKGGRHSSVVFCTNGILLRVLVAGGIPGSKGEASNKQSKGPISDITHIIVDEIHERDRYSDVMVAILRDVLSSYPHLRLILMSATLDAERFSGYFGGCPIIRVPGFTYPVETFFLEDVLSFVKPAQNNMASSITNITNKDETLTEEDRLALDDAINLALSDDDFDPLLDLISSEEVPEIHDYQHSITGLTPLMVFAGKGRVNEVSMLLSFGVDCHIKANDGSTALEVAECKNQQEAAAMIKKHMESAFSCGVEEKQLLDKYMSTANPNLVDINLIEQLLRNICTDSQDGAILVFLPGWEEINKTRDKLLASAFFKDDSKFIILALHSMIPSEDQKKVFQRPPPGCRKIILSTNIAETSVTIDDVVYVVDSGRMKQKSYDPYNDISTLQSSWVSKASAKQREGRAGRCRPGICYHLYSKFQASALPDFQVPEIKRMPIEELCLQLKLLDPNCILEEFLQKLLDPPVLETIHNAIIVLQDIGALSLDEKVTDLGEKLGVLPVHPFTGRMLFFAILMNCLDPALTLACALDHKEPFYLPMLPHEKIKAGAAKAELASLYEAQSDQLAVIAAFEYWMKAKERGQAKRFCSEFFVSSTTMHMLLGMRKQLQSELLRNGFIPEDISSCSMNACDPGILHAVIVAGLYPRMGRLRPRHKSGRRYMETASGDKVRLHPRSINFGLSLLKTEDRPLIVYDEIVRGDVSTHIKNCTEVGPLPVLLLAAEIAVAPGETGDNDKSDSDEDGMETNNESSTDVGKNILSGPDDTVNVVVDRWLPFGLTALDIAQIYCLREQLSAAILFKVKHPRELLPPVLGAYVYATACILSYDGLSGIVYPPKKPVDSSALTEMEKPSVETKGPKEFLQSLMLPIKNHQPVEQRNHISGNHGQKGKVPLFQGKQNDNGRRPRRGPPPQSTTLVGCNSGPPPPVTTLVGYGSSVYGPYGPRIDSLKRQRDSGSR